MKWPQQTLGDVFEIARGGSPRPIDRYLTTNPDGVNWVMISDASSSEKFITSTKKKILKSGVSRSRMVHPGDFLLTNSMSFGRPYIMRTSGCIHDGWLVLSKRIDNVDSDFFFHLLGSAALYSEFERRAAGATVKNLNIDLVKSVTIPLPPLAEQKRIAGILDAADALRAKRGESLAQLDSLLQSTFLTLFGDPVSNPMGWETASLESLIRDSFRNGLSPSSRGEVDGKVLTLSAITSGSFHGSFARVAKFDRVPSDNQLVTRDTFLICRGNGNKEMVGIGVFPTEVEEGVCFPDTMIACTPDPTRVANAFLQSVWASTHIRNQIASGARTTNGTFKVNQGTLGAVVIPLPPLSLQRRFAAIVESLERQKARQRAHLAELDALFASLKHRAFRGEL